VIAALLIVAGTLAAGRPAGGADHFLNRSFAGSELTLPYRLLLPRNHDPRRAYPLVIFLHGAGARGADNEKPLAQGVLPWAHELEIQRPAFMVVPQCPEDRQWVDTPWGTGSYSVDAVPISKPLATVMQLVAALRREFKIDGRRIFITGLSMGGFGTWDLVTRYPETFAAAMPVCGGGDPTQASRLKGVPIWAFHGSADPVVPAEASRAMVRALRAAGARVRYTEYPGLAHNVWDKVYGDEAALLWMLAQRK
jgi:predicted peptidase